jgi:hypothetical protein
LIASSFFLIASSFSEKNRKMKQAVITLKKQENGCTMLEKVTVSEDKHPKLFAMCKRAPCENLRNDKDFLKGVCAIQEMEKDMTEWDLFDVDILVIDEVDLTTPSKRTSAPEPTAPKRRRRNPADIVPESDQEDSDSDTEPRVALLDLEGMCMLISDLVTEMATVQDQAIEGIIEYDCADIENIWEAYQNWYDDNLPQLEKLGLDKFL